MSSPTNGSDPRSGRATWAEQLTVVSTPIKLRVAMLPSAQLNALEGRRLGLRQHRQVAAMQADRMIRGAGAELDIATWTCCPGAYRQVVVCRMIWPNLRTGARPGGPAGLRACVRARSARSGDAGETDLPCRSRGSRLRPPADRTHEVQDGRAVLPHGRLPAGLRSADIGMPRRRDSSVRLDTISWLSATPSASARRLRATRRRPAGAPAHRGLGVAASLRNAGDWRRTPGGRRRLGSIASTSTRRAPLARPVGATVAGQALGQHFTSRPRPKPCAHDPSRRQATALPPAPTTVGHRRLAVRAQQPAAPAAAPFPLRPVGHRHGGDGGADVDHDPDRGRTQAGCDLIRHQHRRHATKRCHLRLARIGREDEHGMPWRAGSSRTQQGRRCGASA